VSCREGGCAYYSCGDVFVRTTGVCRNFNHQRRRHRVDDRATALVLMMTVPGLALFYSGMVRKKNVLATMAQSLAAVAIISAYCGSAGSASTADRRWAPIRAR
jgi:Ammonium Transporter Family